MEETMKCPACGEGMMKQEDGMMKCESCGHTMPMTEEMPAEATEAM